MMQAPTPFIYDNNSSDLINVNDLKEKEIFNFEEYKLTIGLLGENIIFICSKDKHYFQVLKNYDTIIKEIPYFKLSQNIDSIYNLFLQLFSSKRYEIKKEEKNKLKIIIKLKDILGNDELHDIVLFHKELDTNTKMKLMEERIEILEKKVEEMNELKEKVNLLYNLYNENKQLKEEINKLQKNNQSNIIGDNSKIIHNEDEISIVKKEIEKINGSINKMKLLYRATKDGDSIDQFHFKCDNYPNTLMILETTKGFKFGGFTSAGWNNNKGKDIYDKNAFCFSINLNKIYNIVDPKFAMHIQSHDGRPSFGSNNYVFLLQNEFLNTTENYSNKRMSDYKGETQPLEINGGKENFCVKELEVFQIL